METNAITLTDGQQAAYKRFCEFLQDRRENVFVLEGYAGTGKSTLVKYLLERVPKIVTTMQLIKPDFRGWDIQLTATTNKACEALQDLTGSGYHVQTIHSYLGLVVQKDYRTGKSKLIIKSNAEPREGLLLFIDEASYLDHDTLGKIFQLTPNSKIVFMGDPAQLTQVNCKSTPVFHSGFPTAKLTEVVRQAEGNPIIEVATMFREIVRTGEWGSFRPDGQYIRAVDRQTWASLIKQEFIRDDWHYKDSKVLAWTNDCVINYNREIRDLAQGDPQLQVGDYAVVNSHVAGDAKVAPLKTDQMVHITEMRKGNCGAYPGWYVRLDNGRLEYFLPESRAVRKQAEKEAKGERNYGLLREIDQTWIDLRNAYACTINKSQGSTYDKVFIDLNDVRRCHQPTQVARMLYVAVSRARHQVVFTGDIV